MDHDLVPPTDRRITIVLALSAILVVLVGIGTPAVITTSNTTQQVVRSAELNACRSQAAAKVTEARTEFDVARADRDTVASHLTAATNEGLAAAVTGDDTTFASILEEVPVIRAELIAAEEQVVATTRALRAASDLYRVQVIQSREDPDVFLRQCKARV